MFTGLIEQIGTIAVSRAVGGGRELAVTWPGLATGGLQTGDSVAVSGACLTVERVEAERFWARVMAQTAGVTLLGEARVGQRVNLERALKVGDRLGGHFVLGHVDGIAVVNNTQTRGDSFMLQVEIPAELTKYVVSKGSICLDGVSLTVAELEGRRVTVSLVQETLKRTTLGEARAGQKMNVEVDILAKHIEALLGNREANQDSRILELLSENK
jgi:riboflavin synthase